MIKYVTIYGERCSGTNYLEELIKENFDVTIKWDYGWKHFFGFNDLTNSTDTLFIGIIRNPYTWINSFYRTPYHLPEHLKNVNSFLNDEFYSIHVDKTEIMEDRNIYTNERYKNIFEMRYTKMNFLIEDMPNLVDNYILITYENLVEHLENTLNKIKNKGLNIKNNIKYPLNITYYKKNKKKTFAIESKQMRKHILNEIIKDRLQIKYEKKLNYKI
jgi:hypothetical protein